MGVDQVVPEDPWEVPGVPVLICLLGAVAVGIMDQVLWITEVLSEVEVETSIEEVPGVPEVLEVEVQVVLVLGVVIVVVTKTNVGGSKQDNINLTSYFHRYSIQSMSSTIAINDTPISCKFLEKFTFHSFFFLQFMCTTIYTKYYYMLLFVKKNMFYFYCNRTETPVLIMPKQN